MSVPGIVLASPLLTSRAMPKSHVSVLTQFAVVMAGLAMATIPVRRAQACGGFFCNQPTDPFALPVAQTAENVLFAMDRDPSGKFKLEAHVQIFYTGPADRFSWIVPVDAQPTLDVGSNVVFSTLLTATQPSFSVEWQVAGTCKSVPAPAGGAGGASGSIADAAAGPGSAPDGGGVDVAFRGDVGPYDAVVVHSTDPNDPKPLIDWLNEERFFVSQPAARLIADYVKEDKYFVAIRLQNDKGTNEIAPLVMRFTGPGPCVPLRLTSIAALNDLKINLWVLADNRVVPTNFYEIELNQAAIDWFNDGSNYEQLVKVAANEAGGNAFITEYAGSSSMLTRAFYRPELYSLSYWRQAIQTPPQALDELASSRIARDANLLKVLRKHIPLPAQLAAMNIDERTFYNQIGFYWAMYQASFKPFDGKAFVDDLEATLIEPLRKVQALVDSHAKLTRLSTFISPEEMTVDPLFTQNPSLPDVPTLRLAKATRYCGDQQYEPWSAPVKLRTPDGQEIWYRPSLKGPYYTGNYEPVQVSSALARGWARSEAGEGQLKFDEQQAIKDQVARHNAAVGKAYPILTGAAPLPGTGGTGGTGGSGGGGRPGGNGTGGAAPPPRASFPTAQGGSKGCGCRVGAGDQAPGAGAALLLAGLFGFGWRRSRRRSTGI
jgi:MYXO-CTERM domain-containing protein